MTEEVKVPTLEELEKDLSVAMKEYTKLSTFIPQLQGMIHMRKLMDQKAITDAAKKVLDDKDKAA